MPDRPVQDFYPDEVAICYGCGRHNPHGLHIQTFWDGHEGVATFHPQPHHTAFPGFVYGGLLASLIDCHSIGTAIAAWYQAEGRTPDTPPEITCVTANLNVNYLKPTPIQRTLTLRSHIRELSERKVTVATSLYAGADETVTAQVIAVRIPSRAAVVVG
jgi:acyl-coenzyme A thioesterase PaaI-like protein